MFHYDWDINLDTHLTYDNYCKDLRSWQYYNCSYETYLEEIIDTIKDNDTQWRSGIMKQTEYDTLGYSCSDSRQSSPNQDNSIESNTAPDRVENPTMLPNIPRDFNYPDKNVGYLAQTNTYFCFIGPDKEPVKLNSVDKLLEVANLIRKSGLPNYKAREKYLANYSDKRVIQYIKFDFPLSLINPQELHNTEVTNPVPKN